MVDLTISKLDRPKGRLIRTTDIRCDWCTEANFVIEEPGSETPRWLRCYNCDQYYYVTRGILCANVFGLGRPMLSKEKIEENLKG